MGFFQFFQKNYKKSLSLSLSLSIYIYIYETYFIYLSSYNIKNYDIITRIMGPFHIWGLKDNCLTCFYGWAITKFGEKKKVKSGSNCKWRRKKRNEIESLAITGKAKIQANKDYYYYYYYSVLKYTTKKKYIHMGVARGLEIKKNRAKKRNRVMNVIARISVIYLLI